MEIFEQLVALLGRSYAPYSRFPVAAIIKTKSGKLYAGVNVENSAYPLSRCAEQGAVSAMVVAGEQEIAEVWVMGKGEKPPTPCGGCRQVLSEFAVPEVRIHCLTDSGQTSTNTLGELLPYAFKLESR